MCGRFTLTLTPDEIARVLALDVVPAEAEPRYNIAPTQRVLAVTSEEPRAAVWLGWGLVPSWAKDPSIGGRLINARAETLAEKPSFRQAFRLRRCLVLADGFYEWKKEGRTKRPFYMRLRSGGPFTMAGLWESWRSAEEELRTCTIITTTPNALVRQLHDRMPAIVPAEARSEWLAAGPRSATDLQQLLGPQPAELFEAYEVSTRVGSPRVDDPGCIAAVGSRLTVPFAS